MKLYCIPAEISTSRLIFINKDPYQTPKPDTLRPISITSIFQKMLEALILIQLKSSLANNETLQKSQVGFQDNLGTNFSQLNKITHFIAETQEKTSLFLSPLH